MINVKKLRNNNTMTKITEDFKAYKQHKLKSYNVPEVIAYKKNELAVFYSESIITNPKLVLDATHIEIIHHTDMDGDASGAIAYNYVMNILEKAGKDTKVSFLRYNYKTSELEKFLHDVSSEEYRTGGHKNMKSGLAIIVDLSLPKESMEHILEVYPKVIWVDHHGTSIKTAKELTENKNYSKQLSCAIDKNVSATYMAYLLFCDSLIDGNDFDKIRNAFPAMIVSDYDTWNTGNVIRYTLGTYMNQYYYNIGTLTASHDYWKNLFCVKDSDRCLEESLSFGKKLVAIDQMKNDVLYSAVCRYFYVENNYTICIINGSGNSSRFSDMDDNDIKILVRINPDNSFVASIFSENLAVMNMDLGRICREHFNGGGHPGAAGFSYDIDEFIKHVNEITQIKEGFSEGSKVNYNTAVAKISDALAALLFYELRKEINK